MHSSRMRTGRWQTVYMLESASRGGCLPGLGGGGVCLVPGGVSAWFGGCLPGPGGLPGLGGLPGQGGWCLPGPGGSAYSQGGGMPGPGGVCIPACTEADTLPPVDRILDTRL